MNNRYRRVNRLKRKYETPVQRQARNITELFMSVGISMDEVIKNNYRKSFLR